jgi:spore germination cell wall hydrolase CwlJ-like protein
MFNTRNRALRVSLKSATIGAALSLCALSALPLSANAKTLTDATASGASHEVTINSKQERCLATAIYFEARGESERGQRAVADVILARARTPGWPKTICGVVYQGSARRTGCQFSFTCDGRADAPRGEAWAEAKEIAADALDEDNTATLRSALYFHNTGVRPSWCRHMVRVARIGGHIFYRPRA